MLSLRRGHEFVLPAHHHGVTWPDEAVHGLPALRIHVSVDAAQPQNHHVPVPCPRVQDLVLWIACDNIGAGDEMWILRNHIFSAGFDALSPQDSYREPLVIDGAYGVLSGEFDSSIVLDSTLDIGKLLESSTHGK